MKEFVGENSFQQLEKILERHDVTRILLVTGDKSYKTCGAQQLLSPILQNYDVIRYSGFQINPQLKDALYGVELVKGKSIDLVIAIGGGTVIDMAKTINVLLCHDISQASLLVSGGAPIIQRGLPLIAIPTTSGSGSQATHFAVVYIDNKKYSLASEFVLPRYAIVDPIFTFQSPNTLLTATSGIDALCQAIESFWAVRSNKKSKDHAKKAISLILPVFADAVSGDFRAKIIMSEAAHIAGKAINISTTTAPHAISYPLTTFFGIPHGHAVALSLGKFFEINSNIDNNKIIDIRGKEYLRDTMSELFSLFGVSNASNCLGVWQDLMRKVGLEISLKELGIRKNSDIQKVVHHCNLQRLKNNPVEVSTRTLVSALTQ